MLADGVVAGLPVWAQLVFAAVGAVVAMGGGAYGLHRWGARKAREAKEATLEAVQTVFAPMQVEVRALKEIVEAARNDMKRMDERMRDLPCAAHEEKIKSAHKRVGEVEERHCNQIKRLEDRIERVRETSAPKPMPSGSKT